MNEIEIIKHLLFNKNQINGINQASKRSNEKIYHLYNQNPDCNLLINYFYDHRDNLSEIDKKLMMLRCE